MPILVLLPDSDARVGGAEIDTNSEAARHVRALDRIGVRGLEIGAGWVGNVERKTAEPLTFFPPQVQRKYNILISISRRES